MAKKNATPAPTPADPNAIPRRVNVVDGNGIHEAVVLKVLDKEKRQIVASVFPTHGRNYEMTCEPDESKKPGTWHEIPE
jgi:hypothetical protein